MLFIGVCVRVYELYTIFRADEYMMMMMMMCVVTKYYMAVVFLHACVRVLRGDGYTINVGCFVGVYRCCLLVVCIG